MAHSGRFEAAGAGEEWQDGIYPLLARLLDVAGCSVVQARAVYLHTRGLPPCEIGEALGVNRQRARVYLWGGIKRLARADTGWLRLDRSHWRDVLICIRNRRGGSGGGDQLLPNAKPYGMVAEDLELLDRVAAQRLVEADPEWVLLELLRRMDLQFKVKGETLRVKPVTRAQLPIRKFKALRKVA